jgi:hypothetical protein
MDRHIHLEASPGGAVLDAGVENEPLGGISISSRGQRIDADESHIEPR